MVEEGGGNGPVEGVDGGGEDAEVVAALETGVVPKVFGA